MSHNKVKVAGKSPSKTGDITVNLGDLNDITVSPISGQYLQYNGTNWESSIPQTVLPGIIFAAEGATQNYSGSGASGVAVACLLYTSDAADE